jgi:hypothetical protein
LLARKVPLASFRSLVENGSMQLGLFDYLIDEDSVKANKQQTTYARFALLCQLAKPTQLR